jgi:hypothetical protein
MTRSRSGTSRQLPGDFALLRFKYLEPERCNSNNTHPALAMHTPHPAERFLAIHSIFWHSSRDAFRPSFAIAASK